jgi:uncharacterized phage protein (TIGR02220 family)
MARARNIKPGFFLNDLLVEQPLSNRLLFVGLWTIADKAGRLEDRPKKIKMCVFPADDIDIESGLSALHKAGFIVRYSVGDIAYIQVVNWDKHQSPHHTEKDSVIPPFVNNGGITVKERKDFRGNPPDSLIPDSLIQEEETLSGKPDVFEPVLKNGKAKFKDAATEILFFLNAKTGRTYRPGAVNLEMIASRLAEGATLQDCKCVIAKKAREWQGDEKMEPYLRPATLFNRTKFAQYVGELGAEND